MELIVKSRNGRVSDRQQQYIKEKLSKLERHLDLISKITVEVTEQQLRSEGTTQRVQATLIAEHGILLRAEERAPDLYAAIDEMVGTLQRQIQRYKDKHWRRGKLRRQSSATAITQAATNGSTLVDVEEEPSPRIVRAKEIQVEPMYAEEAIEQMELLGHDFFLFRDIDNDQINVVYRRRDGNYGVLIPGEKL